MENKTLRDELAMSMPNDSLPIIKDKNALKKISKMLGLKWSDDPVKQIEWSLKYESSIRYMYADAMLESRKK